MGERWYLVDERGRLFGGPKLLDVLLGLGVTVILLALWQVYRIPFDTTYSRIAQVFMPSPLHIVTNALITVIVAWLVWVGHKWMSAGDQQGWGVRTALLTTGLWVWGADVSLAYLSHLHLIHMMVYKERLLLAYTLFLLTLSGVWFTLRLIAIASNRSETS